jgi:hypothetical protein
MYARTLLEEYDLVFRQTKVDRFVFVQSLSIFTPSEERPGRIVRRFTGHDVPSDDDRARWLATFLLCNGLKSFDSLRLHLE